MWTADIIYPEPNCYSSIYFNNKGIYARDGKMMIPHSIYDCSPHNQMCTLTTIRVASVVSFKMSEDLLNSACHTIGSSGDIEKRMNYG
jgi:hypothetical protein